jgi:fatty-acyl-CoA synthase
MSWHPTRGAGLLASVPNTTSPLGDAAEAVAFPTLACLLERRARVSAERLAVTFRGSTATFAEVQDRVRRTARVLQDGGVGKGDRVAYLGLNHPAILDVLFAAANLGAIMVPLNYRFAGPELVYAINHSVVRTVFADSAHTAVVPKLGASIDLEELREYAGQRIGRYKLPRRLELVDVLPRNATGKVLKTELRKVFGETS